MQIGSDYSRAEANNVGNNLLHLIGISPHEKNILREKTNKTLAVTNKDETGAIVAIECQDMSKLLLIDIIIIFIIIRHLRIFIINPYLFHVYSKDYLLLSKTLSKYTKKYFRSNNSQSVTFISYLLLIVLFLSLADFEFQNIGILLFMSFITFITAEANQMLTGALFSGIIIYLFLRIKAGVKNKDTQLAKCSFPLWSLIKRGFKYLTDKSKSPFPYTKFKDHNKLS